jgi:type II secretory pathway component PulC
MVRSLVIRQAFILMDLALAVGVVVAGGMIAYRVAAPSKNSPMEISDSSAEGTDSQTLAPVGDRAHYAAIVTKGLFGDAGRWKPNQPEAAAPPPTEATEDTQLNLRLLGTIALNPDDPFASAIIENADQRVTRGYNVGEAVSEKVKLVKVYPREVHLQNDNKTPPAIERLRMDDKDEQKITSPGKGGANPPAPGGAAHAEATERVPLKRQEIIADIAASWSDIATKLQPEMYRDATGKVIGVTAANIGQVPLAGKLGLQDNDVLQTVNNEPIDSEEKIMAMVEKYRNAGSFRIGILRNGKPKVITYNLE